MSRLKAGTNSTGRSSFHLHQFLVSILGAMMVLSLGTHPAFAFAAHFTRDSLCNLYPSAPDDDDDDGQPAVY